VLRYDAADMTPPPADLLELVACPACHSALTPGDGAVTCVGCAARYPILDGLLDCFLASAVERPRTTEVTRANQAYHDAIAAEYEQDVETSQIFGEACQARLAETLARLAGETGGGLLVDLGCGTGNVLVRAREHFDRVLGIDVATRMLAEASAQELPVLRGNAYRLPLPDGCAAVVTAFSVLHHMEDLPGLFREIHRVLRPGGAFHSDWDPNSRLSYGLIRLMRHPVLYRPARSLYRWLAGESREAACYRERNLESVFQLAEYHAFQVSCDADRLAGHARAAGLTPVEVRYHANPPSVTVDDWASLSRGKRLALRLRGLLAGQVRRQHLLPLFMLVARRPEAPA
jgi:ubiquinone/menaquinone biosynthesis C-methylase UbiE